MAKRVTTDKLFFGACPICRRKLREDNASVISKNDATTLYCVRCAFCSSSLLFTVSSINGNVTASIGMLTDVQPTDIELLKKGEAINADDVLEFHKFLENYGRNNQSKKQRN